MRKDILNEINFLRKEGKIVINKSELARRLGYNRKTVAKYLNESCCISDKSNNREYTSKWGPVRKTRNNNAKELSKSNLTL